MLNLKKGLALVLAAATAFTFAPVANLGNAVQAEAATVENKITLNAANTWGNTSGKEQYVELPLEEGTWQLTAPDTVSNDITIKANGTKEFSSTSAVTLWTSGAASNNLMINFADDSNTEKIKFQILGNSSKSTGTNGSWTFTLRKVSAVHNAATTASAATATNDTISLAKDEYTFVVTVDGKDSSKVVAPTLGVLKDANKKSDYGDTYYNMAVGQTETDAVYEDFTAKDSTNTAIIVTGVTTKGADDNYYWGFSSTGYVSFEGIKTSDGKSQAENLRLGKIKLKAVSTGKDKLVATLYKVDSLTGKVTTECSATYEIRVTGLNTNINTLYWQNAGEKVDYYYDGTYGTTYKPSGYKDDAIKSGSATENHDNTIKLNTIFDKTRQLNINATGALTFISHKTDVFTVSQTGLITAVGAGVGDLEIVALPVTGYDIQTVHLTVQVSNKATDVITATYNGNDVNLATASDSQVDLDPSTSTSAQAVKSGKIEAKSAAGSTLVYQLVSTQGGSEYGDSAIATVSSDGTVTAGSKTGTVYVKISTPDNGDVKGTQAYVKVVVNTLPQADITSLPKSIRLDLKDNKVATLSPATSVENAIFTFTPNDDAAKIVTVSGNTKTATVTAKDLGYGKITVAVPATAKSRYTTKEVGVAVVDNAAKVDSDLKVADSALTVKVGDTASAGASTTASGAAITYTSSDTDVATVAADGTITAVAPGTAVVTVKAAETDKVNAGTATIVVTVPSNPQKVTGVKVSNKKGAYVTVKWTSQGSNVNYRVYKKVGNGKWVGKNVAGSKTTLSVKKGAKVQVKVKSYVKDASGKTTWGPTATKAKTFKTDKK